MRIQDTERLLASHARLMEVLRAANDLIDDNAANESVAGEGSRPLHEAMHEALADARKVREQIARPL